MLFACVCVCALSHEIYDAGDHLVVGEEREEKGKALEEEQEQELVL